MNLRTTFLALGMLVLLCGGMLFAIHTTFSRDAQMRNATMDFEQKYRGQMKQAAKSAKLAASTDGVAPPTQASNPEVQGEFDAPPSLNDWYASAGKQSGPFDPTPQRDESLINSAEPYVTLD